MGEAEELCPQHFLFAASCLLGEISCCRGTTKSIECKVLSVL